jgi:cyclase
MIASDMSLDPLKLLALLALAAVARPGSAVTGEKAEFSRIADGVYAFIGKRNDANALAVVTAQGVVLADTGNNPPETRLLRKYIAQVTDQPVRYVVITQNHGDHVGGTPLFSPPAHVLVQERVAKDWSGWKPYQIKSWRKRFRERADTLKEVNPLDTVMAFKEGMTLHLGGRTIELIYVDEPHNPGDVAVWLPESRVLHAGFVGYIGRHPDIRPDYSHGTTAGMLKQLDALIALKPRVLVPAHGPLGGAKDLQVLKGYLLRAREKVRSMTASGLPLATLTREFSMSEYRGWDRENHFEWLAETVYRELRGEGPQTARIVDRETRGAIVRAEDEGRRLVVKPESGPELRLRITADTDIDGAATDRSQLKPGMKVEASYQVPEGFNPALGYDVMELVVR